MKQLHRIISLIMAVLLLCALVLPVGAMPKTEETTVLFTHDLHSHFFPQNTEYGGK